MNPVIFLDIDGVLATWRTTFASGNWPHKLNEIDQFDSVAIAMLHRLTRMYDVKFVISSVWRTMFAHDEIGRAFNLPTIGSTDTENGIRGEQIKRWLDAHPEYTTYAILDDSSDMLLEQMPFFVQCDPDNGVTARNYQDLEHILETGKLSENKPYGDIGKHSKSVIQTF